MSESLTLSQCFSGWAVLGFTEPEAPSLQTLAWSRPQLRPLTFTVVTNSAFSHSPLRSPLCNLFPPPRFHHPTFLFRLSEVSVDVVVDIIFLLVLGESLSNADNCIFFEEEEIHQDLNFWFICFFKKLLQFPKTSFTTRCRCVEWILK